MVDAEKLAQAVLLFHRGGEWTSEDREAWIELTGSPDATTVTLCSLARRTTAVGGDKLREAATNALVADLEQAHRVLTAAWEAVGGLRPKLVHASAAAAFAVGEAGGTLSKAKALVGRDIDQLLARV